MPCGAMEIVQSLPGVLKSMVVTVRQFKLSSRVCSRFKSQVRPLLRFWKMDPSLHGVMQTLVVTVRDQLKRVQQIQASSKAFAAILQDGSVVTWGDEDFGGDSLAVQAQLKGVQQIQVTSQAFAAILEDGSVVTWGDADSGGDSSRSAQACAADSGLLWGDGSVVTWGADSGGDSSAVRHLLKAVQQIQATFRAFAAILADGSVVCWGDRLHGGNFGVQYDLWFYEVDSSSS